MSNRDNSWDSCSVWNRVIRRERVVCYYSNVVLGDFVFWFLLCEIVICVPSSLQIISLMKRYLAV